MEEKNEYYITDDVQSEKYAYQFIKLIQADQSLIGCKYLIYAVCKCLKEPVKIQSMTKEDGIYDEIAEYFKAVSSGAVERGIRHVCEKLYNDMSAEAYQRFFGTTKRITNKRIIETACNYIRYELEK